MIKTWQERCKDFEAMHIVTTGDIRGMMQSEIDDLRAALATAQEALRVIADENNYGSDGCWCVNSYPDEIARAALAAGEKHG